MLEPDREPLQVEVVFALPERQALVKVTLESGASVQEAIEKSSIAGHFPECTLDQCRVGIWGRIVDRDEHVRQGDRVEIYRELLIDPRDARRSLATAGKTMGPRQASGDD
jgi:hypothetical protein